jgi:hypothetical protein
MVEGMTLVLLNMFDGNMTFAYILLLMVFSIMNYSSVVFQGDRIDGATC